MPESGGSTIKESLEGRIDLSKWPGIKAGMLRDKPYKPEKHPFTNCAKKDCSRLADIEILWANGRAITRFCREHYLEWYKETGEGWHDIVRAHFREDDSKSNETTTLRSLTESTIHRAFTVLADQLFALGYLERAQRIALSNVIGDILGEFGKQFQKRISSGELSDPEIGKEDIMNLLVGQAKNSLAKDSGIDYNNTGEGPGHFRIFKQADDTYRWVSISSTTILDKVGEIVTRKGLDRAIRRGGRRSNKGDLTFWHIPWIILGQCDFQAREGLCLVESGLWADTPLASKAREKLRSSSNWGISIEFKPVDGAVQEGVQIDGRTVKKVFDDLEIHKRSILPKWASCAHFTSIETGGMMEPIKETALRELIGDDETEDLIHRAKEIGDQAIAEGMIFKDAEGEDPPPEDVQEDAETKGQEGDETTKDETTKDEDLEAKKAAEEAGGLIGAIKTKLSALRKKVSGDVAEDLDEIIALANQLRGLRQNPCPDDYEYPKPKKEGDMTTPLEEIKEYFASFGETQEKVVELMGTLSEAIQALTADKAATTTPPDADPEDEKDGASAATVEDDGAPKKAAPKTDDEDEDEDEDDETPKSKEVPSTELETVVKEIAELRTLLEKAMKPVRKSALPSEKGEGDEEGAIEKKSLSGLDMGELKTTLRLGLKNLYEGPE